jgi:hypothetical protein
VPVGADVETSRTRALLRSRLAGTLLPGGAFPSRAVSFGVAVAPVRAGMAPAGNGWPVASAVSGS